MPPLYFGMAHEIRPARHILANRSHPLPHLRGHGIDHVSPLPVAKLSAKRKAMTTPLSQEITALLTAAFSPTMLEVINDSSHHAGHSGDDGTGESHFTVLIESAAFVGISRLERQRQVIRALGDIPGQRVHALAIKASVPAGK
jgi:BolA protein